MIIFKIKIIENNQEIVFKLMIILNNNNHNSNKYNTYNKPNTYKEKNSNNTYLLRPNYEESIICSVNNHVLRSLRLKGSYVINSWYKYNLFCLIDSSVSARYTIVISR